MGLSEFVMRMRLGSGLVLLVYVVAHLTNHTLGIVSLEAMNAGLALTIAPWRTLPGTIVLYGATGIHIATVAWSLYQRQTLRLAKWQLWQTILGLTIPAVLAGHVVGTRGLHSFAGFESDYIVELTILWITNPEFGALQVIALIVV